MSVSEEVERCIRCGDELTDESEDGLRCKRCLELEEEGEDE